MEKFRSAYSPPVRVVAAGGGVSLTKQSFKNETDINRIIGKYRRTGLIDHVNRYQGRYSDLSNPVDYQTALNVLIAADDAFSSLPSDVRKKFSNSPHEFLTFVSDPANADALVDMGLMKKPAGAPGAGSPAPGAAANSTKEVSE